MTNKNCSGCITYTSYIYGDAPVCVMTHNNRGDCPCAKCVVKMMCEETCEKFEIFKMEKDALGVRRTLRSNPFIKGGI